MESMTCTMYNTTYAADQFLKLRRLRWARRGVKIGGGGGREKTYFFDFIGSTILKKPRRRWVNIHRDILDLRKMVEAGFE